MKNTTLLLPGFHLPTLRRKPRSTAQKLVLIKEKIKNHSISQIGDCFREFIPSTILENSFDGSFSRRRIFSKSNTFWAFFSQILDSDGGCKEVVRKVQAYIADKYEQSPSASTSAYCQARGKLNESCLQSIFQSTAINLTQKATHNKLNNRRVIVVDGTCFSMPDSKENQQQWSQPCGQKSGCGFPQIKACACFCLQTGALISYEYGDYKTSEIATLRKQYKHFKKDDIFLGDKGFCNYYDISKFQEAGVDSVVTLAQRKPIDTSLSQRVLGEDDLLISWPRPRRCRNASYSKEQWQELPKQLTLRQIKVKVQQSGFRCKSFHIITTLLDPKKYPKSEIAELYLKRWDVELFFRDIKTTMGMDILKCLSPAMIKKEMLMYFIVYNCIRFLMFQSSEKHNQPIRKISFKSTIQILRQWEPTINQYRHKSHQMTQIILKMLDVIAKDILYQRLGRREPRCLKRRPKPYDRMTRPRAVMMEIPHRSRYRANKA